MRQELLDRVRAALEGRERLPRPYGGHTGGGAPGGGATRAQDQETATAVTDFRHTFEAVGGEVVLLADLSAASDWARGFAAEFTTVAQSDDVPGPLRLDLPSATPDQASLGVSWALSAAADTGSVVLSSREGRRLQILPPVHLVWIAEGRLRGSLVTALQEVRGCGASALALHSGPSKSADIGQMVVTGVHGPARVVVAIVKGLRESGDAPSRPPG